VELSIESRDINRFVAGLGIPLLPSQLHTNVIRRCGTTSRYLPLMRSCLLRGPESFPAVRLQFRNGS
jgi:hypothetical protein